MSRCTLIPKSFTKFLLACSSLPGKALMIVELITQSRPAITLRLISTQIRPQTARKYTPNPNRSLRRYNWLSFAVSLGRYPHAIASVSNVSIVLLSANEAITRRPSWAESLTLSRHDTHLIFSMTRLVSNFLPSPTPVWQTTATPSLCLTIASTGSPCWCSTSLMLVCSLLSCDLCNTFCKHQGNLSSLCSQQSTEE